MLFHPNHIAVIGVSRDGHAVGSTIYHNIVEGGFSGTVYPVNPFLQDFQGVRAYPSVLSIPETIDMALVVVPAHIVPSVLEEIGKKGIPVAIIISSGFSELDEKGKNLELESKAIAEKYKITVLGPNCLGIIHPDDKMNASFARTNPLPGSIAFISQSGALGTAFLDIITPKGIGLSHFISLGNKMGIKELDLLEYLLHDPLTSVIGMYVEQLADAEHVVTLGRKYASLVHPKPIVILKGGKTKEGNIAVRSHTGALAGTEEAYGALFRQSMMIEVRSLEELVNTLICFAQNPLPEGNNCVVVTNAGGAAILATDTLVSSGVSVEDIDGMHNPIDLLGDANAEKYQKTLNELEQNPSIHSILGIITPQSVTEIEDTANAFCIHKTTTKKPLAVACIGDGVMKDGKKLLEMGHVAVNKYPEQTAAMLANLHRYTSMRKRLLNDSIREPSSDHSLSSPVHDLQSTVYNPNDPFSILSSYGIPVPPYVVVQDPSSLSQAIQPLGNHIVVKILSQSVIHKTDAGLVRLDIPKVDVPSVAEHMIQELHTTLPLAAIDAVLCMDMVDTKKSIEYILGIKKEPGLGTMIMLGLGGIFVELLKDVTFRFAPLTMLDCDDMVSELRSQSLFTGIRGMKPLDSTALKQALMTVSRIAVDHPEITELDINPLLVKPESEGVVALDCRLTIEGK